MFGHSRKRLQTIGFKIKFFRLNCISHTSNFTQVSDCCLLCSEDKAEVWFYSSRAPLTRIHENEFLSKNKRISTLVSGVGGGSPVEIRQNTLKPGKICNKLKFGTMAQDHVLSHEKKSLRFGRGTFPFFGL